MDTTFAFWPESREFESRPGQVFFYFFYQNETKSEEICDHESLWPREIVKLVLLDFSMNECKNLSKPRRDIY